MLWVLFLVFIKLSIFFRVMWIIIFSTIDWLNDWSNLFDWLIGPMTYDRCEPHMICTMVCRHIVDRQNVDRHNVEPTKCRQANCRTDSMSTGKMHVTPCMQNNEETIAKYVIDANLFRLGSTNLWKDIQPLNFFFSTIF